LVNETALALAVGAVNMIHALNPQLVLFAGGMTCTGDWFLELIRSLAKDLPIEGVEIQGRIGFAKLGEKAGVVGAAAVGAR
jgi:glucokinase